MLSRVSSYRSSSFKSLHCHGCGRRKEIVNVGSGLIWFDLYSYTVSGAAMRGDQNASLRALARWKQGKTPTYAA